MQWDTSIAQLDSFEFKVFSVLGLLHLHETELGPNICICESIIQPWPRRRKKIALGGLDRQVIKIQLTGSLQLLPSLQMKIFYIILSAACVTHSWCTHLEVLSDFPLSLCLCASGWVCVQEVTGHSTPLSSHPLAFLWTSRFSTFGEEGERIPQWRNNKLSATVSRAHGLDTSMTLPAIAVNSGGAERWETLDVCLLQQELLTRSSASPMRFEHWSQSHSPCCWLSTGLWTQGTRKEPRQTCQCFF